MLLFVHVIGFYLYSVTFAVCMPRLISLIIWIVCDVCKWHCVETRDCFYSVDKKEIFRDQHWLLSSRTKQIPWCKYQGTEDGHIQIPKSKYQPVCCWQPKDHRHHPEIKHTCSKIHNYFLSVIRHKELKIRAD